MNNLTKALNDNPEVLREIDTSKYPVDVLDVMAGLVIIIAGMLRWQEKHDFGGKTTNPDIGRREDEVRHEYE